MNEAAMFLGITTETLLGAAWSCFGGALVSCLLYVFSGRQLKKEAEQLRRLSTILLSGLENAGVIGLTRTEDGSIKGNSFVLNINESFTLSGEVGAVGISVDSDGAENKRA